MEETSLQALMFSHEQFGNLRVRVYPNQDIEINLEDAARGLGFIEVKKNRVKTSVDKPPTYVLWNRVKEYLNDVGCASEISKDAYIPEPVFYMLAMKVNNAAAKKFQEWLARVVIPAIHRDGFYKISDLMNQLLKSSEEAKYAPDFRRVYVFGMSNNTVKIGYSKNIRQRMSTIISSSGLDIINVHATEFVHAEIAYMIEQACHETFDEYRTRGEFFRISFAEACRELDKYAEAIAAINKKMAENGVTTPAIEDGSITTLEICN